MRYAAVAGCSLNAWGAVVRQGRMAQSRLMAWCLAINAVVLVVAVGAALLTGLSPDALFVEGSIVTLFSALQLLIAAALCLCVLQVRSQAQALTRTDAGSALWLLMALGLSVLALDEAAAIHEALDHLIHRALGLRQTPLTDRIDDLIILCYAAIALIVLHHYRRELRPYRRCRPAFVFAFGLLLATIALDLLTNSYSLEAARMIGAKPRSALAAWSTVVEDSFKLLSEGAFVAALASVFGQARGVSAPLAQMPFAPRPVSWAGPDHCAPTTSA